MYLHEVITDNDPDDGGRRDYIDTSSLAVFSKDEEIEKANRGAQYNQTC